MGAGEERAISIPNVELLDELGRGASSIVYRGLRAGKSCAVKIARASQPDVAWFRREAATLARVRHAGVPSVLDVGEVDGRPYIVLELVEGETLADRLERNGGVLSVHESLRVAGHVLDTLEALHRRGLVHRDISPRNIVLEPTGAVRLVDFGFATFSATPDSGAGTRAYLAPEQRRDPVIVDGRTDLYSLGAVLAECWSGAAQLREANAPTESMEVFLRGLLADDPSDRYADAAAVAADVARLNRNEEIEGPQSAERHRAHAIPFVGRAEEQRQLRDAWQAARRGTGRLIVIRGDAGTGKSRLLDELVGAIASPSAVCVMAVEGDPRPFATLRRSLDAVALSLSAQEIQSARDAVGEELTSVVAALSPGLARQLSVDPGEQPPLGSEAIGELALQLLTRLARARGGLAIFIDDAQWIEPSTADVLARLSQRIQGLPLLLVLAGRHDPLGARLGWDVTQIELRELSAHDAERMVAGFLGTEAHPDLLEWVGRLTDGTPLGTVELVSAMVDIGALTPEDGLWHFAREKLEGMSLPSGALGLLERRVAAVPGEARAVLLHAAVLGRAWEHSLLSDVTGGAPASLNRALDEAARAGLVEAVSSREYRFVHDSVRQVLLRAVEKQMRRKIHAAAAAALSRRRPKDVYEIARHYMAAGSAAPAEDALRFATAASEQALTELDSDAAGRFFDAAVRASERLGAPPTAALLELGGEAALRRGAYERSIRHFRAALDSVNAPLHRARILCRIAWAEQARPDERTAWLVLEEAFRELDEPIPGRSPASTISRLLARSPAASDAARLGSPRDALLGQLYFQVARLGIEYERPLRVLESMIRMRSLEARLSDRQLVAKIEACYGTILTFLGFASRGARHVERGLSNAIAARRPDAEVYCLQVSSVAALFRGEFDRALELIGSLLDEKGAWLEMHDYCLDVYNAYLVETLRGRPQQAWAWLERPITRVSGREQAPSAYILIAHCAQAVMSALQEELHPWQLRAALRVPVDFEQSLSGFVRKGAWGPRARYLVETGRTTSELDELVAEFGREGISPRRAHPILVDYYSAVAEGRVHRALRTRGRERETQVRLLGEAIGDLRAVARYPLFEAHLRLAEGFHGFLTGDHRAARKKLARAERLADQENAPGILYGVARAHAHILAAEGKTEASRERARVAMSIARSLGAVQRGRWIQQELGGAWSTGDAVRRSVSMTSRSSSKRQLRTLLRLLRTCNSELDGRAQASAVLDELLESVSAARGMLLFDVAAPDEPIDVGRTREEADWAGHDRARATVTEARARGEAQATEIAGEPGDDPAVITHALAVPLFLGDRTAGAMYVERRPGMRPFGDEETDLLIGLSYQVPIALELARALVERTRLEEGLRRVQRMESIGRFAGGIVHDFNNMLTVMHAGLTMLKKRIDRDADASDDLKTLENALEHAGRLTNQLRMFARKEKPTRDVRDVGRSLDAVVPMLTRVLGKEIDIRTDFRATHTFANIDPTMLEQCIVNLALNASDAMPHGGTLTIETDNETIGDETPGRPGLGPSEYVVVRVRDTGTGMPKEVLEHVFEPFYTTKSADRGTGLGLSIVHSFIQQSGGAIQVRSEVGEGTEFCIYLPRATAPPRVAVRSAPVVATMVHRRQPGERIENILVVEDERLFLNAVRRNLEREGFHIFEATEAQTALTVLREHRGEIDLVISDVTLPGMSGTELARAVTELSPTTKLLLMSGYGDEDVSITEGARFLQKPFATERLTALVHEMLGH